MGDPVLLLFGATGAIGSAAREKFLRHGWRVVATGRVVPEERDWRSFDPFAKGFDPACLDADGPYDAVLWAQGANRNDSVTDVDLDAHRALYDANCVFVLAGLKLLTTRNLLSKPARLCVVSSIWQELARQNKLSYCMTKAALSGLVLSAATDLAADGHLINAVLPGVLDTPMTRKNLAPEQVAAVEGMTRFGRLPTLTDVVGVIHFLCSQENTGITGQFITADLGFSHARLL
jgi:3-oxoacyl-[acyl-carrier protein] reductase